MPEKTNKKIVLTAVLICFLTVGLACSALAEDKDASPPPGYPAVNITNKTGFYASGEVWYGGAMLCKDDSFSIPPGGKWSHSRGLCLIGKITASVDGKQCEKYESKWGTGYAMFEIVGYKNGCKVIRP